MLRADQNNSGHGRTTRRMTRLGVPHPGSLGSVVIPSTFSAYFAACFDKGREGGLHGPAVLPRTMEPVRNVPTRRGVDPALRSPLVGWLAVLVLGAMGCFLVGPLFMVAIAWGGWDVAERVVLVAWVLSALGVAALVVIAAVSIARSGLRECVRRVRLFIEHRKRERTPLPEVGGHYDIVYEVAELSMKLSGAEVIAVDEVGGGQRFLFQVPGGRVVTLDRRQLVRWDSASRWL